MIKREIPASWKILAPVFFAFYRKIHTTKAVTSDTLQHILLGGCQHQLDSVQLIDFTGSRIIVYGDNIGSRMPAAKLLDDSLSDDMIGQAAKGLSTDNILHIAVNQLQHFTSQEPSFAGLIAQRHKILSHGGQIPYP